MRMPPRYRWNNRKNLVVVEREAKSIQMCMPFVGHDQSRRKKKGGGSANQRQHKKMNQRIHAVNEERKVARKIVRIEVNQQQLPSQRFSDQTNNANKTKQNKQKTSNKLIHQRGIYTKRFTAATNGNDVVTKRIITIETQRHIITISENLSSSQRRHFLLLLTLLPSPSLSILSVSMLPVGENITEGYLSMTARRARESDRNACVVVSIQHLERMETR